jgi:hypothetical protein
LGLAIVRHLAEAHGGSVAADSDGPRTGATFVVRLPIQTVSQRLPEREAITADAPTRDGSSADASSSSTMSRTLAT